MSLEFPTHDERNVFTRRDVLRRSSAVAGLLASGAIGDFFPVVAEEPTPDGKLIVRSRRPVDLETPVGSLNALLTPNDVFFVRSHLGVPAENARVWPIELNGLVSKPLMLDERGLDKFPKATVTAVLQCAGNGRAFFKPLIPGVGWERGGVGNAEWGGIRLADVLAMAGIDKRATHVHFLGADGPPNPKTPLFLRSIPIEKAMHPDTILATTMNGAPLPLLHGGPVRLVVPGWCGNHWLKWVRLIKPAMEEAPGFYMQTGYRMPKTPTPPDVVLKPSDLKPVTSLNVKSLITWPLEGSTIRPGKNEVRGVAWTGEGQVTRVEVALGNDSSSWSNATFEGEAKPWSWRRWRLQYEAPSSGKMEFKSRATDSNGETQPETTPWNKSGYLWNAIDRVNCEVG